jgi:hypothetical protein
MTQALQIVGMVVALIGAVVFGVASLGQMRAAREREIGTDSPES